MKGIAKSLITVQSKLKNPYKNETAQGAKFSYQYVTLDSVLDAIRPLLSENGLALFQSPFNKEGDVGVKTTLLHESGEMIESEFAMTPSRPGPQEMGSLITYCRRYAVMALFNIAGDKDDDAKDAMPTKSHTAKMDLNVPHGTKVTGPVPIPKPPVPNGHGDSETVAVVVAEAEFTFGKFKGKQLKDIPVEQIESYWKYLSSRPNFDRTGKYSELFDCIEMYLENPAW